MLYKMDADEIERIIDEELNKMDLSEGDVDDYAEEDLTLLLPEDDSDSETDGMPESVLTYFEAARDRMSVFEKHLQEDQEENNEISWSGTYVVSCQSEDILKDLAVSADEDPVALKEKILSELEEQLGQPTALDHQMAVEDSTTTQNGNAVCEPDEYLESEQRLQLQIEDLESRLKQEEQERREAREAGREQLLLKEKEEEERRRRRQKEFAEELNKIDEDTRFLNTKVEEIKELTEVKMELELANQKEAIKRLEEQMEEERRVFEEVQEEQRRRQLERRQRAATKIQAAVRTFLTLRWTRPALNRKREEERRKEEQRRMEEERREREERLRREREAEEKRREEEKARQREEQERRRAAYEKAKQEERQRLEHEKRLEEERRIREEEEERRRREEEERRRAEEGRGGEERRRRGREGGKKQRRGRNKRKRRRGENKKKRKRDS
ncbi:hypothetical protein AALO_G00151800 [Alosa alosa]|uniref:Uncharacterized protein n=1 Tax=Alosa alosa TaxID=278164 RepID=A0AAV6GEA7_9TELE|nr:hypothetical protein AALO_G00151800 [Alosa alosa]